MTWSACRPRSASNSSTSRYESEKRKYQPTASRIISGSNWRHLNRPATEGARTISAQLIRPLLQSCNTSEMPALALFSESSLQRFQLLGAHLEHWRVTYCVVKLTSHIDRRRVLSSEKAAIDRHHVSNRKARSWTAKPDNG